MYDIRSILSNLKRPKLLVRAARHGVSDYDRKRDLRRIAGFSETANQRVILSRLLEIEDDMEKTRKIRNGTYCVAQHIEVLVALMAESLHLPTNLRKAAV